MTRPMVGIIMGSDSDLGVMLAAAEFLDLVAVEYETTIVSAHRTVKRMVEYAESAKNRGLEVIIAGAGGAAHLPGMTASLTNLPVIGVPIKTTNLDGIDSLLSIAQMPAGIPVATVAINGGKNAGILACRILGLKYPEIQKRLDKVANSMKREVLRKALDLEKMGPAEYRRSMKRQ